MTWTTDLIIFDFDGVRADTGPDIANAANYVLKQLNLPQLPPETIISFIGGGAEPLVRQCLGNRADELFDKALALFKKRYSDYPFVDTVAYPGVPELQAHYRAAGKTMTIATNKTEAVTWKILEGLHLTAYFQVIVGPDSITQRKPHPEALQRIIAQVGGIPAKTVMIGDTEADILAGQSAGTITGGVTYGYGKRSEIEAARPDFIIDEISSLLNFIE
jgi:2-phosphoglycolate phosphatase